MIYRYFIRLLAMEDDHTPVSYVFFHRHPTYCLVWHNLHSLFLFVMDVLSSLETDVEVLVGTKSVWRRTEAI